jgi:F-type H+-transporting ATPase subunit b
MLLTAAMRFAQEAPAGGAEKSPNPILPATNEIIWGAISFLILLVLITKFAYPAVKKGIDARAEKIRGSLDEAERTRDEANTILEDYRRQLADAKNESSRIIEEARQSADKLRQDLKKQAEAEVAEIKSRAQEDIAAQVERAMGDLRARVADMTIELTEKVVQRNLDRETNLALIERFIDEADSAA